MNAIDIKQSYINVIDGFLASESINEEDELTVSQKEALALLCDEVTEIVDPNLPPRPSA